MNVHDSENISGIMEELMYTKIEDYEKANVIILDEPTNHMDIIGKEHLENINISVHKDYSEKDRFIFITNEPNN